MSKLGLWKAIGLLCVFCTATAIVGDFHPIRWAEGPGWVAQTSVCDVCDSSGVAASGTWVGSPDSGRSMNRKGL